ncbi:putative dolichyl pyrophosphate phosphatase [Rosellinia necatrix]|uniref:Putative dolichyl pyrophosphate phosphatase n=1 Tax=Rosellinia necatrix TaxID=77044 RepID=A0A1S7UL75_ROSNE|nr:putative dolichyl pyrophosphate phosphatase [Rosellinia necatrix]
MFELPEAKRVRRKDLYDSGSDESGSDGEEGGGHHSSSSPDESALHAKLSARLAGLFDFSFTTAAAPPQPPQQQQEEASQPDAASPPSRDVSGEGKGGGEGEEEEQVYAFRLFRGETPTHTVVLTRDDDPRALGDGAFVVPSRPRSHYLAGPPSPRRAEEYRSVAVSAADVLAGARRRRCWGLEKPWRVVHIASGSHLVVTAPPEEEGGGGDGKKQKKKNKGRTRPGKKHRILLRVREKAAREREEAARVKALEKDEHLQEKKKRLNRERKLKRRQKEREKKAEARAAHPIGGGADVNDDDTRKGVETKENVSDSE